jgi:hypothetical protein
MFIDRQSGLNVDLHMSFVGKVAGVIKFLIHKMQYFARLSFVELPTHEMGVRGRKPKKDDSYGLRIQPVKR